MDNDGMSPGHSNILGPEIEWKMYLDGEEFQAMESRFWWTVEHLVLSFPGDYDSLPWQYTEQATRLLMM